MQLRDYQTEAVESVFRYFANGGNGHPLVAMPTGTGKSLVIAGLVKEFLTKYPGTRILVITHVKELIEQNARKLVELWPSVPYGIYSAGLRRKDTMMPVVFGGCASIVNNLEAFGRRDIIIVDECHLISPKDGTTYQKIISGFKALNPNMRVIGLSATPFRLGQGMLIDDGLFTDICCDMTGVKPFNRFIQEGHLVPLIPRATKTTLDLSNVGMVNGDYAKGELQAAVDKKEVTQKALLEMCELGSDRNSWLIFASGVEHAEHIAEQLLAYGVAAASIHSKMADSERDKRLAEYKEGKLRCLVNNNVLTTGFDHPPLDCIGMLRPTMSPGLWVQMLGRGTRPSPDTNKENCLVLDFAGNTKRLGPINDPVVPKKKGKGNGDPPIKICEECGTFNHISVRNCVCCGAAFVFETKIVTHADTAELIKTDVPVTQEFYVDKVSYYRYEKPGKPDQIRADYTCSGGAHLFSEYVQFEHGGWMSKKAREWWKKRTTAPVPRTTAEALLCISALRVPYKINVWVNKKYPEIISVYFGETDANKDTTDRAVAALKTALGFGQ
jgi:DNA repair protein RadD